MHSIEQSSPVGESEDRWEKYKDIIIQLYKTENRPLRDMMDIMETRHNFLATSKVYKHRLRSWGCRKQIRLKDHEAEFAQAQLLATKDPSGSDTAQQLLALPDGQTVDLSRLRKYLRRNKHWLYGQRKANLCTGSCPSASVMRPPDVFYVRETLYHNTRAYILGRFQDSIRTPADFDEMRGASPHSSRWLAFAHKVQMAVVECRFDDAVTYLREAPKELNHLLIHQPSNILSNLFRFLTSVIRFLPLEDPGARQFLEVLKALLRYGATCLKTSESTCGGVPSRGQPLRLVLESLAKLDDREILLVARRAWSVGCQTDLGLMDEPATVNANIDLLTIMSNGGGDGSELPSNFDDILEQTLKRYEAEGKGHLHLVTMMNRPIYLQMVAEAQGRDPFLDERIVKAFQDAEQCICNMNKDTRFGLHQYFNLPLEKITPTAMSEFLAGQSSHARYVIITDPKLPNMES